MYIVNVNFIERRYIMEFLRDDETLDDLQLKGIHVIQKKHAFR